MQEHESILFVSLIKLYTPACIFFDNERPNKGSATSVNHKLPNRERRKRELGFDSDPSITKRRTSCIKIDVAS
jgi:hypothetical protein